MEHKTRTVCGGKLDKPNDTVASTTFSVKNRKKPFVGRKYFLHVRSGDEEQLTKQIKKYGGDVADMLDNVNAVITDDCCAKMYTKLRERGETANHYSSSPVNRESAGTPTLTQQTADSAYGTFSSSSRRRVSNCKMSTLQRKSSGDLSATSKLEQYYLKMPSIIRQAVDLHITLTTAEEFTQILADLEAKFGSKRKNKLSLQPSPKKIADQQKPLKLFAPCLKFEDEYCLYAPVFKQFDSWPIIYIRPGLKGTPFEQRSPPVVRESSNHNAAKKAKKAGTQKNMVTKKTTKRQRKLNGDCSGYCDLCNCYAHNVEEHVKGECHRKSAICAANFKEFDELMNIGPSLSEFVESVLRNNEDPTTSNEAILEMTPIKQKAVLTEDFGSSPVFRKRIIQRRPANNEKHEEQRQVLPKRLVLDDDVTRSPLKDETFSSNLPTNFDAVLIKTFGAQQQKTYCTLRSHTRLLNNKDRIQQE